MEKLYVPEIVQMVTSQKKVEKVYDPKVFQKLASQKNVTKQFLFRISF